MPDMIQNPILSGFYPDPSICRVEDDFYMVTSSFSYFPGVPVFHSRDLKHWEQLGHVIDRPEQTRLESRAISGGIYAPTLRYHDGLFYMVTTNVSGVGDFICTAKDPAGPWSDIHVIHGAPGIDPSLFWDEDGTCIMCGTGDWNDGYPHIWGAVLDTTTWTLGEKHELWRGALHDCWAPEAPHIYQKDGWYYLLIAEGGTEHYHAVTMARSKDVLGKYKGFSGNPILTHRHLGWNYPICNTGHADLVQLRDGSWYMVMLASRIYGGYHKNLGRETFITPVDWSGEWPVVNPGHGCVGFTCPAPNLPAHPFPVPDADDLHSLAWNTLGSPTNQPLRIEGNTLYLRCLAPTFIPQPGEPASWKEQAIGFYGRRQQHMRFQADVQASLPDAPGATCGLAVLQHNYTSLRLELKVTENSLWARALKSWADEGNARHEELLGEAMLNPGTPVALGIHAEGQSYTLLAAGQPLATADGGFLGSETAGGFVGAYIGMYASGNGVDRLEEARFTDFHYRGLDD